MRADKLMYGGGCHRILFYVTVYLQVLEISCQ